MGTMGKTLALEVSTSSFVTARHGHDSRNSSLCAGLKKVRKNLLSRSKRKIMVSISTSCTEDNEERRVEVLGKHIVVIYSRVCNKQFHIVATHIFHFFELLVASFSDTLRKL